MMTWEYLQRRVLIIIAHGWHDLFGLAVAFAVNWLNEQHLGNYTPLIAIAASFAARHGQSVTNDALSQMK